MANFFEPPDDSIASMMECRLDSDTTISIEGLVGDAIREKSFDVFFCSLGFRPESTVFQRNSLFSAERLPFWP